jgi:hypothetical protein
MTDKCPTCGRSDSQVIADARALGLLQEFQCGRHTCCQISEWADEQWWAWFKAANEDANYAHEPTVDVVGTERLLVPIRFRRPQVPWYRNPNELT